MRTLVGVSKNPLHKLSQIIEVYDLKMKEYIIKLNACTLGPQEIMFGYQRYWWPWLKFIVPSISFKLEGNILTKLHAALLPKLHMMKIFLVPMRSYPVELGGLGLYLLEVESIVQAINYFVSLYIADTPIRLLLKTMIEHMQLEVGITDFFLMRSFKDFKDLVMDA